MSLPWFRMYAEAVDDEKLRLLAFEDRWHFVALLCLKAMGTLDSGAPLLERRIALKLGLSHAPVTSNGCDSHASTPITELKRRLIDVGLIDRNWQPLKWGKRQFNSDHSAAERKRKQRDRELNRDSHMDVTPQDCDSHTPEQNRTDTEQNRADKSARSSRLPDDFVLTPERRQIAEQERVPPERTFASFCDYWRGVPGNRGRKLDWEGTWRNWCRKEGDSIKQRGSRSTPGRGSYDEAMAALDALPDVPGDES